MVFWWAKGADGKNDICCSVYPYLRCGLPHTSRRTANIDKVKDLALIILKVSLAN